MQATTKAKIKLKKPPILTARTQELLKSLHARLKLPVLVYGKWLPERFFIR